MTEKTVLFYGDSNTHGTKPLTQPGVLHRFGASERWPGLVRSKLGSAWQVIEEGLPTRTTVHDDPIEGRHKNGLTMLRPCLESHLPIDVLVLMLGTNDLKARFSVTPSDIAGSIGVLLREVHACHTRRPTGRPVSESCLARGRPTNPARIPVSPKGRWYQAGPAGGVPKLLVLSPAPILETGFLGGIFAGGVVRSAPYSACRRALPGLLA